MKRLIYITFLLFSVHNVVGQELKPEYQQFIKTFIENVKDGRKEAVAAMISYPLKREHPIPAIKNKTEFIKRYNLIFDTSLKNEITKSDPAKDWSEMGWRGIMLNQGTIWIDSDGKLTAINYQSKYESDLKNKLIKSQKKNVNSNLATFKTPVCILETSKFRVRIDDLGDNNFRYASWPIKKSMKEEPDLIIDNGKLILEGSGGNHQYQFKKGNYIYECAIIVLGEKNSPPAKLIIYQDQKQILLQDAVIVK